MIRLPITSISLSDQDVGFHLQQVEIYSGLLRQGFKKNEIARYFEEHRLSNQQRQLHNEVDELGDEVDELRAPTCVELALRPQLEIRNQTLERKDATATYQAEGKKLDDKGQSHQEVCTVQQNLTEAFGGRPGSPTINTLEYERRYSTPEDNFEEYNLSASPIASDFLFSRATRRHAPRKSSLLRFAETASPAKMPSESDVIPSTPKEATQMVLGRSTRSHTDSYHDAEIDISTTHLCKTISGLDINAEIHSKEKPRVLQSASSSSMLRAEAASFIPINLSSAFDTSKWSSTTFESEDSSESSPESVIRALPGTSSTLDITDHQADLASSPAASYTNSSSSSSDSISLPPLPDLRTTPSPNRQQSSLSRTDPRTLQQLYEDGSFFTVYNESLPAHSQPQTPADLGRRPLLTEREAAYTAPPGALRNSMRPELLSLQDNQGGDQSPTVRAMGIRERRNRELLRSVRIHGRLANRMRDWNPEGTRRGLDGNDEDVPENNRRRRRRMTIEPEQVILDTWRDELEGDRVGEENFDTEIVVRRETGIRVVSGNAQRII